MTTYKEIFGKPIKVLTGDPAPTPITYTVTVANPGSGNKYYIDGVLTPTLELYEGNTYNFDYSGASSHPFRFSATSDGTHNSGTEYTDGVSVDSNITTIVVPVGAPTLYYYCSSHSGMGGTALTPSGPSEYEGQIWYNETTGKFRSIVAGGAWSSTSPMINSVQYRGGGGTPTAMFAAGGSLSTNLTEEYNGIGWSPGGNIGTARYEMGSAGTLTAGLIFGGYNNPPASTKNETEEYNGTSWSEQNNLNTARYSQGGFGIQTAAVYSSGFNPSSLQTDTEEYNGTSWSEGNNPAQARYDVGTGGTLTAGIIFGGGGATAPVVYANTELYDGTNWTAGPAMNTARSTLGGSGTQTAAIGFGGRSTPVVAITEQFDGTSWTEVGDLATARRNITANRSNTGNSEAIAAGGSPGSGTVTLVEQWNFTANTVTGAAWSSGGALPQGVSYNSGAGIQTAALSIGGQQPSTSAIANTYEYNGSSWSEGGPIAAFFGSFPTPTSSYYFGACGTQTAAVIVGGAETNNRTVEYNGSSWTQTGNYPSQISQSTMNGIQTAAINISGAGSPPGYTGVVANYNGSSWTASPVAFSPAGRRMSSAGTYTATIVSGGSNTGTITSAQEWDGSSWTTVGAPNAPKNDAKSTGIQTAALKMNGGGTESYDGSSWATAASMANNRSWCTGGSSNDASNTSAAVFGGSTPSFTSATEEFNGETTSLNKVNISSS